MTLAKTYCLRECAKSHMTKIKDDESVSVGAPLFTDAMARIASGWGNIARAYIQAVTSVH